MVNPRAAREWLVERGIGEDRALLLEGDRIVAARLRPHGELPLGIVVPAKLISKRSGARRGVAFSAEADDLTILVDKLPREITEGADLLIEITRAPIAERGRLKHAQGRLHDPASSHPNIADEIFTSENEVFQLPLGAWEDVWQTACQSEIEFGGGAILISVTPAMTLIDIDGDLPPRDLGLAAVPAFAQAINWFELGGNIGIDFPTLDSKADRRAVDDELDQSLKEWSHERTAMNGFGFVQLVARLERPSLLHRLETSRISMCARFALRMAERAKGTGPILLLTTHPALKARLKPEWLNELARRTGRQVRIETDPGLALEAPNAQIIAT